MFYKELFSSYEQIDCQLFSFLFISLFNRDEVNDENLRLLEKKAERARQYELYQVSLFEKQKKKREELQR